MGFHNVDYDSGVNPFDKIRILNDQGALEVIISDESKDLKNLRITDAKFFNSQGEFVPTTLDPGGLTHESSSQQNASFFFRMTYRSNMHFERPPFHLKISGFDGATPFSIDAKFTDQVHYQMINLEDALDHG